MFVLTLPKLVLLAFQTTRNEKRDAQEDDAGQELGDSKEEGQTILDSVHISDDEVTLVPEEVDANQVAEASAEPRKDAANKEQRCTIS